jgi:hypothetical protein
MEVVGGLVSENVGDDGRAYALSASVEELLEMTGVVLVVCGLWHYLGRITRGIDLRLD